MGAFDKLFAKDTEKAALKQFRKEEASAEKWPSMDYYKVLDVYLTGDFRYEYGEDCKVHVYQFPELIDHEKAIALCRAGADPANVRKMQRWHGKQWSDPGDNLRMYLVGLLPDGPEREKLVSDSWRKNYAVAYYVYRMGWVDQYCKTLEDKLKLYDFVAVSPQQDSEKDDQYNYGIKRWVLEELYGGVHYKTRRRQGQEEITRLLRSENKEERDAAARFVQEKSQERQNQIGYHREYLLELARYARDEMDMRFRDPKTGKRYRMKEDDTFEEVDD